MTEPLALVSQDEDHTQAVGCAVGTVAGAGDIIALVGELGAGKTQFVRGMALGMGIDPKQVSSPTFVLMREYASEEPGDPVLVHIDAYRLKGPDDLATIGWGEHGEEWRDHAVVAVEWADLIEPALGDDWLEVAIKHAGASRWIGLSPHGRWEQRVDVLRRLLQPMVV